MGHLVWIIDEEWSDYNVETEILKQWDPDCEIKISGYDYEADFNAFGKKADLILAQVYAQLPGTVIEKLEHCKGIAISGGGYDRVDVDAARRKGIPVANVQGYCAEDLADYVLAAIFHFNKRITAYSETNCARVWGAPAVPKPNKRISNSTLLIIGCGRIGCTVAKRAQALGMTVLGSDPYQSDAKLAALGIQKVELRDGLERADFISVNAKYTWETDGILSMKDFQCCKPSACLINTARGRVLVEQDLIDAVNQGILAGAVVDVIANEPPVGDEAIFRCPGIVVTPHISYISQESMTELKRRSAQNAIDMAEGKLPADVINL